jgi:probable HAF family extracellular repeat protein
MRCPELLHNLKGDMEAVMRQVSKSILILLIVALAFVNQAQAKNFAFRTVDIPGAVDTVAMGINDSGQIVGTYGSNLMNAQTPRIAHGFVFQNGQHITYDVTGAEQTWAYGINKAGKFVGEYLQGGYHPFLHDADGFTTLNIPGALEGNAHGINSLDWIAGHYDSDGSGAFHGFLKAGINITVLNVAGAWSTSAGGINDSGLVVGDYRNSDHGPLHGFTYDNATQGYGLLDFPGASTTSPHGINNAGQIVGSCTIDGKTQGFLYEGGKFITLNFPGATTTAALGINAAGQITGTYLDSDGKAHGFVASRKSGIPAIFQLLLTE